MSHDISDLKFTIDKISKKVVIEKINVENIKIIVRTHKADYIKQWLLLHQCYIIWTNIHD